MTKVQSQFDPRSVRPHRRRGALLMELMAATALFGLVVAIAVPLIGSVTAVREETHRRQLVQIELANVMERVAAARRTADSFEDAVKELELSSAVIDLVPDASLAIDVAPEGALPQNLRVTARVTWTGQSGEPVAPVELTAFFKETSDLEEAP